MEKTHSHRLIYQIENYFKRTTRGRTRSAMLIPEPLFVHSDLTTGVQIADLIAYIVSWGTRLKGMSEPHRGQLTPFWDLIKPLRFRTKREVGGMTDRDIWSITYVK